MNHIQNVAYAHTRAMKPMPIPPDEFGSPPAGVLGHWQSRDFLAVLYQDRDALRLTINRTRRDTRLDDWVDGITWDELMTVKAQCGFADTWALEIYPPNSEVVNVANMRHLWLHDDPPPFGWQPTKGIR